MTAETIARDDAGRDAAGRDDDVVRYTLTERVVHWLVALSFVYAALSGMALWSTKLYWLAAVLGGGEAVRAWHPWGGVVYGVALGVMFARWAKQMRLDRDDRKWLRAAHRYAVHDEVGLPESGRFNAGQKMLFWLQSLALVAFVASGIVLWFPEASSQALRLAAVIVHSATAVLSIALVLVHLYMGVAVVPGSLRAMVRGSVTRRWAASHHPRWYREVSGR